jgi:chromosome segregation ATPase
MSERTGDSPLELAMQIQTDTSQLKAVVRDIKARMTATEESLAGVNRRLDRVDDRLERLERRVGLVEG